MPNNILKTIINITCDQLSQRFKNIIFCQRKTNNLFENLLYFMHTNG